jgi:hypothetical protein
VSAPFSGQPVYYKKCDTKKYGKYIYLNELNPKHDNYYLFILHKLELSDYTFTFNLFFVIRFIVKKNIKLLKMSNV